MIGLLGVHPPSCDGAGIKLPESLPAPPASALARASRATGGGWPHTAQCTRRCRGATSSGSESLGWLHKPQLTEPPDADPHVRWCGRGVTGIAGYPLSRSRRSSRLTRVRGAAKRRRRVLALRIGSRRLHSWSRESGSPRGHKPNSPRICPPKPSNHAEIDAERAERAGRVLPAEPRRDLAEYAWVTAPDYRGAS